MDIVLTLSIRSIRLHGLRSILATMGIIIGVVAIASMGMMGANLDQMVTSQLSSLGNVLVVRAYTGPATGFEGFGGRRWRGYRDPHLCEFPDHPACGRKIRYGIFPVYHQ
jgi:hypothetical protein